MMLKRPSFKLIGKVRESSPQEILNTDGSVEILEPDQHIATLNKEGKLNMEMVVKMGKGYGPAERLKDENTPIGVIAIDATCFMRKKSKLCGHQLQGRAGHGL